MFPEIKIHYMLEMFFCEINYTARFTALTNSLYHKGLVGRVCQPCLEFEFYFAFKHNISINWMV